MSQTNTRRFLFIIRVISGSFVRYYVWCISAYLESFKEYACILYRRYLTCSPQNLASRNKTPDEKTT